ncbi:MAG: hypothetical protein ACHQAV_05275 [Solirubrobacterales bacterium]
MYPIREDSAIGERRRPADRASGSLLSGQGLRAGRGSRGHFYPARNTIPLNGARTLPNSIVKQTDPDSLFTFTLPLTCPILGDAALDKPKRRYTLR